MKCFDLPITLTATVALSLVACGGGSDGSSGSSSGASSTVITVPGAPTVTSVTAGNASATVTFTAPASTGGAAITSYTATCTGASSSQSMSGGASPLTISSLTNGTVYSCTVTATNSAGTGAASSSLSVTPTASSPNSTAAVDCPYNESTYNTSINLTSNAAWACAGGQRTLTANGIPDHAVGTFPNANNPNTITVQAVSFLTTLTPAQNTASTAVMTSGFALNGVKFDPATAGTCPSSATTTSQCMLANGTGPWSIEAYGQSTFDFGLDSNNAHVQPNGAYHYHGMPEGTLTNAGITSASPKMLLVGFAQDGFPIYARYGHSNPADATSALKVMHSSYQVKTTLDSGRPPTSIVPAGAFTQDYQYVAGLGDLDACNGRFDVTPEFPQGIYHYYITDSYPFIQRCTLGTPSNANQP